MKYPAAVFTVLLFLTFTGFTQPTIYANQIGYDAKGPKIAVIGVDHPLSHKTIFSLINTTTNQIEFTGVLSGPASIDEWTPGRSYYHADFSLFKKSGKYVISSIIDDKTYTSYPFVVEEDALARLTISSIIHYYHKQRANTPQELAADSHMHLIGSDRTVDVHGGWCDASGDVSKYFSHLAYANFMSPQQTPLVVWSMVNTSEAIPALLNKWHIKDSLNK
jgi:hypothetical protein